MIERIEVNGFKSLSSFVLDLKPGLNILVGPNGAGKTNIISFFEFLSQLTSRELSDAVGYVGGAGSIFKKVSSKKYHDSINATVYGVTKHDNRQLFYKYEFTINASESLDSIYFHSQELSFSIVKPPLGETRPLSNSLTKWQFIFRQSVNKDLDPSIMAIKLDRRRISPFLFFADAPSSRNEYLLKFSTFLTRYADLNLCMLHFLSRFVDKIQLIKKDLNSGETFNIVPSRVRAPENSSRLPGIERDGAGLAATLYAMQVGGNKPKKYPFMPRRFYLEKRYTRNTKRELIRFVQLANPWLTDITVYNDQFENVLRVRFMIKDGNYESSLPMAAMSDGTLKWIALISAIMTSRSLFALEEPENYLHPHMQSEILSIMRSSFADAESCILMSSHSETLVNSAEVDELIVISMSQGNTKASRPNNRESIRDEINATGFGLGYYYLAGALDDD